MSNSKHQYGFKKGHENPIRAAIHWWTHRRSGMELICDAVILALAAIVLDFFVLFVTLVVDSLSVETEPPALISGLGAMLVRAVVVAAILLGGIGFVRFAREGADTMKRKKIAQSESKPALTNADNQDNEQREAA